MEDLADTVAAVFAHHGVVVLLGVLLDDAADIPRGAGPDDLQGRYRHSWVTWIRPLGVRCHLAHLDHDAGVAVELVLDDRYVDVDDIAVFELARCLRNAVADHVVDRGADGRGKPL